MKIHFQRHLWVNAPLILEIQRSIVYVYQQCSKHLTEVKSTKTPPMSTLCNHRNHEFSSNVRVKRRGNAKRASKFCERTCQRAEARRAKILRVFS